MMEILSTSQPTVSATLPRLFPSLRLHCGSGRGHAPKFFVDALDEVVPLLVQFVDVALGRGHLMVIRHPRFVLLVPQDDIRRGQTGYELAEALFLVGHRRKSTKRFG